MPKSVEGYVTEDGTFFESSTDAEFYEASTSLAQAVEELGFSPESYMRVCLNLPDHTRRYLNAIPPEPTNNDTQNDKVVGVEQQGESAVERVQAIFEREGITPEHGRQILDALDNQDNRRTEAKSTTILKQPSRIRKPVPDMGSGQRKEAVQTNRKVNGAGMRRSDAPSVRGGEDMAATLPTEFAETRRRERLSSLREGQVDDDNQEDE